MSKKKKCLIYVLILIVIIAVVSILIINPFESMNKEAIQNTNQQENAETFRSDEELKTNETIINKDLEESNNDSKEEISSNNKKEEKSETKENSNNKQTNNSTSKVESNNSNSSETNSSNKTENKNETQTNTTKPEIKDEENEEEQTNDSSTNNTSNPTDNNTTTNKGVWDELGITEYDYYNTPMWSWLTVTHSTEAECIAAGEKVKSDELAKEDGKAVLYTCTEVYSYSGNYLGEMLEIEYLN